jgi:hypothetical protein
MLIYLRLKAALLNTRKANNDLRRALRERDKRKRMSAYYRRQRERFSNV